MMHNYGHEHRRCDTCSLDVAGNIVTTAGSGQAFPTHSGKPDYSAGKQCVRTLAHLHEVLLGLIDACHVVKRDARVRLHLELGLALAKRERVVAAGAAHAAL